MGFHLSLDTELLERVDSYINDRPKPLSKTEVVRRALRLLFTIEDLDWKKESARKEALSQNFVVPKSIPHNSFLNMMYMLAENYPFQSAKSFWSIIYKPGIDKTHKAVYAETMLSYKTILSSK